MFVRCLPSIPTHEVVKIHPAYREHSDIGIVTLVESGRRCVDLEVPAIVTSEDFWEAAYREERSKRVELEAAIRMLCMDHNIEGAATKTPLELNEMLKQMLHIHQQTTTTTAMHSHGYPNKARVGGGERDVEFMDSGGNVDAYDQDVEVSFPSPPPSPPPLLTTLEQEAEREEGLADAEISYAAPGFTTDSNGQNQSESEEMGCYYDVNIEDATTMSPERLHNDNMGAPQSWISPVSTPVTSTTRAISDDKEENSLKAGSEFFL